MKLSSYNDTKLSTLIRIPSLSQQIPLREVIRRETNAYRNDLIKKISIAAFSAFGLSLVAAGGIAGIACTTGGIVPLSLAITGIATLTASLFISKIYNPGKRAREYANARAEYNLNSHSL